jgi:hypothetical protein
MPICDPEGRLEELRLLYPKHSDKELEAKLEEHYEKKVSKDDHQRGSKARSKSRSTSSSAKTSKSKERTVIEEAILHMTGLCDGAEMADGQGFNKDDAKLGHRLAHKISSGQSLSDEEKDEALEMLQKYRNTQLEPAGIELPSCENGKQSQAAKLVEIALSDGNELWHASNGEAYITISVDNHRETYPLRSKRAKDWLSYTSYSVNEHAPGSQSLQDAITVLEGIALYEGDLHQVYVRVAPFEDAIFVDLGDETWEAIVIKPDGWSVISNPPVYFMRPKSMLSLPRPVTGGSWNDLRDLLNASDDQSWVQIVAWLIQAYWPKGPYAHLVLNGEQGSGKSKVTEILKALIDPSSAPLRRPPRQESDLMIAAQNERILAYDNLSGLSKDMSDALCCLSTGSSIGKRALYTDSDESLMSAKRPCILNGIDSIASRGDLLDRVLIINLDSIPEAARKKDRDIMAEFERLRPSILGLILNATRTALKRIGSIDLANLPRMADFAEWVVAAEPDLPWEEGEFLKVYRQVRDEAMSDLFENDRFAKAVFKLVNSLNTKTIEATASELLEALNLREGIGSGREPQGWPKAANKVTSRLRRIAPQLRAAGVHWTELERTGASRGIRIWIAENNDDAARVSPA